MKINKVKRYDFIALLYCQILVLNVPGQHFWQGWDLK